MDVNGKNSQESTYLINSSGTNENNNECSEPAENVTNRNRKLTGLESSVVSNRLKMLWNNEEKGKVVERKTPVMPENACNKEQPSSIKQKINMFLARAETNQSNEPQINRSIWRGIPQENESTIIEDMAKVTVSQSVEEVLKEISTQETQEYPLTSFVEYMLTTPHDKMVEFKSEEIDNEDVNDTPVQNSSIFYKEDTPQDDMRNGIKASSSSQLISKNLSMTSNKKSTSDINNRTLIQCSDERPMENNALEPTSDEHTVKSIMTQVTKKTSDKKSLQFTEDPTNVGDSITALNLENSYHISDTNTVNKTSKIMGKSQKNYSKYSEDEPEKEQTKGQRQHERQNQREEHIYVTPSKPTRIDSLKHKNKSYFETTESEYGTQEEFEGTTKKAQETDREKSITLPITKSEIVQKRMSRNSFEIRSSEGQKPKYYGINEDNRIMYLLKNINHEYIGTQGKCVEFYQTICENRLYLVEHKNLLRMRSDWHPYYSYSYGENASLVINKSSVPYDFNRVRLSGKLQETPINDYICASFINDNMLPDPIIIAQTPLEKTISDFWAMIYEKKADVIFCLCDYMQNRVFLKKYWPTRQKEREFIGFKVTKESKIQKEHYRIRKFIIIPLNKRKRKFNVTQYHLNIINKVDTNYEGMNQLLHIARLQISSPAPPNLLVHCLDGNQYSPIFIAMLVMRTSISKLQVFSPFLVAVTLRMQLMNCFSRRSDYLLLYKLIARYLSQKYGYELSKLKVT